MPQSSAAASFYQSLKDFQLICGKDDVTELREDLVEALVHIHFDSVNLLPYIDSAMFKSLADDYSKSMNSIDSDTEVKPNPFTWGNFCAIKHLCTELGLTKPSSLVKNDDIHESNKLTAKGSPSRSPAPAVQNKNDLKLLKKKRLRNPSVQDVYTRIKLLLCYHTSDLSNASISKEIRKTVSDFPGREPVRYYRNIINCLYTLANNNLLIDGYEFLLQSDDTLKQENLDGYFLANSRKHQSFDVWMESFKQQYQATLKNLGNDYSIIVSIFLFSLMYFH